MKTGFSQTFLWFIAYRYMVGQRKYIALRMHFIALSTCVQDEIPAKSGACPDPLPSYCSFLWAIAKKIILYLQKKNN